VDERDELGALGLCTGHLNRAQQRRAGREQRAHLLEERDDVVGFDPCFFG
jgi:hypothetical protein